MRTSEPHGKDVRALLFGSQLFGNWDTFFSYSNNVTSWLGFRLKVLAHPDP